MHIHKCIQYNTFYRSIQFKFEYSLVNHDKMILNILVLCQNESDKCIR